MNDFSTPTNDLQIPATGKPEDTCCEVCGSHNSRRVVTAYGPSYWCPDCAALFGFELDRVWLGGEDDQ